MQSQSETEGPGRLPGKGTGGGENRSECLIGIEFQICLFFFFFLIFLGLLPRHMEFSRLGGESEV